MARGYCAVCKKEVWLGATSLPDGQATCRDCRRLRREIAPKVKRAHPWTCLVCGITGVSHTHGIKLCEAHRGWKPTHCTTCGAFHYNTNQAKAGKRVYCSESCRPQAIRATPLKWRQCDCGKWICKPRKCYCSTECRRRSGRPERICDDCGTVGLPPRRKYCDQCRDAQLKKTKTQYRKNHRHRYGKSFRARARHHGVDYESVDRIKVYERDGWRCGICRQKVNRLLKAPHPMSASLDHIVPMSHGGGHLYVNCQLAHHRCNSLKSDRQAGDQLALIG